MDGKTNLVAASKKYSRYRSGSSDYLAMLANQFQEKTVQGIEKLPLSVKQANERYAKEKLNFQEGDAKVFNNQLLNSAEAVIL